MAAAFIRLLRPAATSSASWGPGGRRATTTYSSYAELGAVLLAGVETRDDRLNLGLVILKSGLLMGTTVLAVKTVTRVTRPDGRSVS